MPTYEFLCKNTECNHTWEEIQSIKDLPLEECPECKQLTAKRLISASAFILAGGGVGWGSNGYSGK